MQRFWHASPKRLVFILEEWVGQITVSNETYCLFHANSYHYKIARCEAKNPRHSEDTQPVNILITLLHVQLFSAKIRGNFAPQLGIPFQDGIIEQFVFG